MEQRIPEGHGGNDGPRISGSGLMAINSATHQKCAVDMDKEEETRRKGRVKGEGRGKAGEGGNKGPGRWEEEGSEEEVILA